MKKRNSKITILLVLALTFMSFTTITEKPVKTEESSVVWKGYKVGGEHTGTINLKSGTLLFDGKILTGGSFIIDMTTINTTDLEGEYKGKLDGHLKSNDFFGVEEFPTATLEITSVSGKDNQYNAEADITIKGITETITFPITVGEDSASVQLKIDRTKHNITYQSPSLLETIKDKAIYNDFDLNVTLKF